MQANLYQSYKTSTGDFVKVVGYVGGKCKIQKIDSDDNYLSDLIDIIDEDDLVEQCIIHDVYHAFKKDTKYIAVPYFSFKTLKPILSYFITLFEHYIPCEIYRKKINQNHKEYVVFALKDERYCKEKKKSATKGYAKRQISINPKIKCCFCNGELNNTNATTEHIIPFSQCYNNTPANFCVTCKDCNDERGVQDFYSFLAFKKSKYLKHKYPGLKIKKYKMFI